jgi:hypothetical protein
LVSSYLAAEYEAEQQRDGQLSVAEEDNVEQVRVGRLLQEQPEAKPLALHIAQTHSTASTNKQMCIVNLANRLCGPVVRVPGYRHTGPGFDSRRYQII